MLSGFLDGVTSTGYINGWAYDTAAPIDPPALAVLVGGEEIARGIANRYRADLADSGHGTGWCAFRFRISCPVGRLRRSPATLVTVRGGTHICHADQLALIEDHEPPLDRMDDIVRNDPTVIDSIEQLRGCAPIFAALIEKYGVESFIRAAYVYVLGRAADRSGIEAYARMLNHAAVTPFGLLYGLCNSEEFRAAPRRLTAPTEPGFIFNAL
jgi:hypothetical protein